MATMTTEHKTATFIRDLTGADSVTKASLYKLDPPIDCGGLFDDGEPDTSTYVRVSAANVPFGGPETYIFASDDQGAVTNWSELEGSYKGGLDHVAALAGAGYEVVQ